ncbi:MAG: polyphenol oxidase family protein [Deltaproteobacteria bacterium]|nr:polyphenol oxidase family protein [Deltaproteobacteria bacterium]
MIHIRCFQDESDALSEASDFIWLRFFGSDGKTPEGSLCRLKQVHSTKVLFVSDYMRDFQRSDRPEGDGLYSVEPGERLCIRTADCLPLVLWSRKRDFLAVLHAGWRGLFRGILEEAVRTYQRRGGRAADLSMLCGPCISRDAFEVGPELMDELRQTPLTEEELSFVSTAGKGDRLHMDLAMIAALIAMHQGLSANHLSIYRSCTYSSPESWYSFRRSGTASPANLTCAAIRAG